LAVEAGEGLFGEPEDTEYNGGDFQQWPNRTYEITGAGTSLPRLDFCERRYRVFTTRPDACP
jgi:hypothetical protein